MSSIQSSNSYSLSFANTPNDIITCIEPKLDNQAVFNVSILCKTWQKNTNLKARRDAVKEDKICLKVGFPKEMINAFRVNKLSLWKMPILDLRNKENVRDYIDFLNPEDLNINGTQVSVMRLIDPRGRLGVAFCFKGKMEESLVELANKFQSAHAIKYAQLSSGSLRANKKIKDFTGVLSVFQRDPKRDVYNYVIGKNDKGWDVDNTLREAHEIATHGELEECNNCSDRNRIMQSTSVLNYSHISTCLAGTNAIFKFENVIQVDNPVPPSNATTVIASNNQIPQATTL